ncbi:MAG: DUF4278 domain-containing protein [Cyanosarcina radialis HA8281-LM2]|jgi:hypothetical protein|nr:DUF4278 domain-containing protein [Cyanosarcina radialis HA8281-LM2]
MQLQYRGIPYERNSTVITATPSKAIGKYRGAILKAQHYVIPPIFPRSIDLKYRGVDYCSPGYFAPMQPTLAAR